MAFTLKGKNKLIGSKKKDTLKWANYPVFRQTLIVKAGAGNDVINNDKTLIYCTPNDKVITSK